MSTKNFSTYRIAVNAQIAVGKVATFPKGPISWSVEIQQEMTKSLMNLAKERNMAVGEVTVTVWEEL